MSTKNTRFDNDPFAQREAQKYQHPVPSREFILDKLTTAGQLLTLEQVAVLFDIKSEQDYEAMRRRLVAMERDGQLMRNRRNEYGIVKKMDLIRGRIIGHPDGYGFVVADEGDDDLFINNKRMRGLLHGDRVVVRVCGIDHKGRREAAPVEVLERANTHVVGRFHLDHGIGFVLPNNKKIAQDILIPQDATAKACDGQIVVAEIVEQPTWRSQPIGRVTEILGDHMAPGMEIDIAIRSHELPDEWSPAVQAELTQFSETVSALDAAGREDLRDLPLVTIDGEDARDFDDAVYAEPKGKGWRLVVAIADVSHYVTRHCALDKEALNRGNSVYFPGRVIPMLPEVLSNGLCSLKPHVDRLCLACELEISAAGQVRGFRFFTAVMRSAQRFTYTEVAALVDGDVALGQRYAQLLPHIEHMNAVYQCLLKQRQKRGTIEFNSVETQIVFGDDKKIDRIVPVVRNDAHKMIEEFMIVANVAAATFLTKHKLPIVYRVHHTPTPEKLANLRAFLAEYGLKLGGRKSVEPKHYRKLLATIQGRDDAHLIETVLLRSMSQAVYCPENHGHFGLAFAAYTHFTSPIRRYPDLLVHRAICHLITKGKGGADPYFYETEAMEHYGEHCSMTERRADDATRDTMDWLKCEYMQDKVGQVFEGSVVAVTNFGIFVRLNDVYVEGLVHVTGLGNDYFHYDSVKHRLVGERTKSIYRLLDAVRVKLVQVNLDDKKIDFELVDNRVASRSRKKR